MVREVELTKGQVALVDDIDYEWVSKKPWHVHKPYKSTGYYARRENENVPRGCGVLHMHREILTRKIGRPLGHKERCDHINGNTLDNRRENLRPCTQQQNIHNKRGHRNSSSKYKGVGLDKKTGLWIAKITTPNPRRHICIGRFDTEEEAAHAYNAVASYYFGDFAWLNEI